MNIGIWNAEGKDEGNLGASPCQYDRGRTYYRLADRGAEEPRETGAGNPQSETNNRLANQRPNRMTSMCSLSNQCVLILAKESCLG